MDFDITALEGYYATRIAHTCTLEGLKKYVMPPSLLLFLGLHELHRTNMSRVIFNIDFEKAYDKVK